MTLISVSVYITYLEGISPGFVESKSTCLMNVLKKSC